MVQAKMLKVEEAVSNILQGNPSLARAKAIIRETFFGTQWWLHAAAAMGQNFGGQALIDRRAKDTPLGLESVWEVGEEDEPDGGDPLPDAVCAPAPDAGATTLHEQVIGSAGLKKFASDVRDLAGVDVVFERDSMHVTEFTAWLSGRVWTNKLLRLYAQGFTAIPRGAKRDDLVNLVVRQVAGLGGDLGHRAGDDIAFADGDGEIDSTRDDAENTRAGERESLGAPGDGADGGGSAAQ